MAKGIHNMGNTCYINSTIQCLACCEAFKRYIVNASPSGTPEITGQLKEVVNEITAPGGEGAIIPRDLMKALYNKMGKLINMFEQNDINEFLTLLIDKVNEEVCRPMKKNDLRVAPYRDTAYDHQRMKMDQSWYNTHKKEFSPLKDMFYGQLISQILCSRCGKIHHNYEVFMNLMAPIDGSKTLDECIRKHLNEEEVSSWKCDGCKGSPPSKKTIKLWRLPQVLTITLKRFTSSLQKINDVVDIPLLLDMSPFMIGPGECRYMLKAAAFHAGSFHGGHYFAMCSEGNGAWKVYDDESIHNTAEGAEKGLGNGYVFFYESLAGP